MPTDTFSWLHLTDFHYGLTGQDCLWPNLREPFLDSLAALHERCGPWDAVFFTGDLVQSGESAQFNELQTEVLDPLWQKLGELGSGNAVLLAVPGNHDLYRPDPRDDDPAAERLLESDGFERVKDKFWDQPAGSYRRVIGNVFAAYREWWEKAPHRPDKLQTGALPGDFSVTLERNGRRIGIVGLNVTFLQLTGGDYEGRLVWDARQLHAVCDGGADVWSRQHDVCLLLTHQGPSWLTPEARKHGESEIAPAGRFAAHLFGHQHETEITYLRKGGGSKPVLRCQGCSVFGMEKFGDPPATQRAHGYAAGRIEFGEQETVLRLWPRIATNKTGPWRFVPDHEHAELESDEGTRAEPISARPRVATHVPPVTTAPATTPVSTPPTPSAFVPHSTLPARRPFFGRTKDLEQIAKYLLPEDRSWGVVLDGPGGIGKTALALEAAHRAPAEHFPLKLWVTAKSRELHPDGERSLRDHRVADYYALLAELGQALGRDDISRAAPEERPNLVRHALANHRALLVLDNLETFGAEERRRVFELLGTLPVACRALVTSRRRVGGSFAAHALRLDKLEREAADELLAELGQRWSPIARLTPAERDQLYAETGGNPLLLTWTAGQLGRTTGRCRTVAEAVERLQEAHRLEALNKEKNDPLDFVFGDLAETFTAAETAVLAALVHFTQPAPIAWLLPLTGLSEKAAETALDGLRDRALLVEDDVAGTWLLPPLAARFLRRVRPEAVGASGERLAERAYALAVENGGLQYDRFPVLEAAWPQLAAALPLLLAGGNARLQEMCNALSYFLNFTGRWDDLLVLATEVEAKAGRTKDFISAGWWAYSAGSIHYLCGQAAEVMACAERAAVHWQVASAGANERASVLRLRGHGYLLAKDYPAALAAHREALDLWRSLWPRSRDVLIGLSDIMGPLYRLGRIDEAETHCREALAMAKALPDRECIAAFTGHLAELALDRQQWPDAESLAREALKLAEALGNKEMIAYSCWRLAKALARQGRGAEGRCHAERAVAIFAELRSKELAEAQAMLAECQA
ncbi:MAG: tetratricopeptide repeat protein [Candidatus Contendobacter sp.]|nr:tetratricopeptide repeat protein [Candidatus Contendobacter sp.]MDS4057730.1 tetratricopeptide repeat protein [Candidatus Contendobacter sp.]